MGGPRVSTLAPLLQAFFTDRLVRQRNVSSNTVAAYRDTFRLLLRFVKQEKRKAPAKLDLEDLDASVIGAFLEHLETARGNCVRTRNARLTAVHSFFNYCALHCPERAEQIQRVLAIPEKRFDTSLVSYLVRPEIDALLASPDRQTWTGRRDHTMLLLAVQTGLRVSELVGLRRQDVELGDGAHVRCYGKGRKERCTPLPRPTVAVLRVWLREHTGDPASPLFPTRSGRRLTRGAIWRLVTKHTASARDRCSTLAAKQVTPHVLRHTAAMTLLHAGVDTSVIALWLGHEGLESTKVYLHADMALKERALARTAPHDSRPDRYRASDELLTFLDRL
jgi:integrase/recombinase XerD